MLTFLSSYQHKSVNCELYVRIRYSLRQKRGLSLETTQSQPKNDKVEVLVVTLHFRFGQILKKPMMAEINI
jgi:hypothetical protein